MKTGENTNLRIYADMIERGDVIVGEYLAKEIDNLMRDLSDSRFVYDTTESNRRFAFQEKFCLQSKAPYYMQPIKLMPWQKAFWESLYSFHFVDSGLRRFTEGLLLVGRKNGKSTCFAADGMTDLFIGDGGTSIVCASNDDRQAKLIWREIAGMRGRLDPKKKITSQNLTEITNKIKNIEIFRLSSKTQNKDGFNIDKTYCDESHDMQDDEITQACWRGMSSKDEPLFINCTTQGFINDGYLDKKIEYCRKVIDGEIDDLQILAFLYEQDSESEIWADSASWEKSNPSIRYGVKKTNKLMRDLEVARYDNGAKIHLLCKDFNIKQNTAAAWLSSEDYTYNQERKTFEDFRGCFGLAAVDLSETTDLTNLKILLMKPNDATKYVFSHYWIPAGKLERADDSSAGAKYKDWARAGLLTICDGFDNNLVEVADYLANLKKQYDIRILKCGYDQRFAREFLERCDYYGIETERILQTPDVMSTPAKQVEAELKAKLINYGENPIDRWCLSNTSIKVDNLGRILPVKINGQHSKRIDGAVTLIILYATLQRYKTEYYNLLK
jgi:phage terminase large subunit-like protein